MKFINLTPHEITVKSNGETHIFPTSGIVAGIAEQVGPWFGLVRNDTLLSVKNIPEPVTGTIYIVSMPTLLALNGSRPDCVCPITRGHGVEKNERGQISSVPGFRTLKKYEQNEG